MLGIIFTIHFLIILFLLKDNFDLREGVRNQKETINYLEELIIDYLEENRKEKKK